VIVVQFFVMNNTFYRITYPSVAINIDNLILFTNVHRNRNLRNRWNIDFWWFCLTVLL
jgi:hypothetical protein